MPVRTTAPRLRPHQNEALAAVVRALENPDPRTAGTKPRSGLRATAVMACGTGKTRLAAAAAERLTPRGRVLVLVPTLDLLTQTVQAWQGAGRTGGTQVAVCSLDGDGALIRAGIRATTSAARLGLWLGNQRQVTVYGTYSSLAVLTEAHEGAYGLEPLPAWDLVVVDEAHRTSGHLGKAWAAVHDDLRLPALRRLYLTATPRIWEPGDVSAYAEVTEAVREPDTDRPNVLAENQTWDDEFDGTGGSGHDTDDSDGNGDGGAGGGEGVPGSTVRSRPARSEHQEQPVTPAAAAEDGEGAEGAPVPRRPALPEGLAASMDDEEIFGPVVYRLELAAATRLGLLARPEVVVVEIDDPDVRRTAAAVQAQLNAGPGRGGAAVLEEDVEAFRGARLAALQAAVLKTAGERVLRTVLTFHARVAEAEAFAEGLPAVGARLHGEEPLRYPGGVAASWLCGTHDPDHRRDVLRRFELSADEHGEVADTAVLANVRVLGEGVDLRCESVVFADPKASVVEIVQAIGRALRQNLGEGKTATIVVPVFLTEGERPDDMLTSASYRPLVRVLHALAAHDARVLDMLAVPQASGRAQALREALEPEREGAETEAGREGPEGEGEEVEQRFLLRFSTLRDPAVVAEFVRLRVINPERRDWRRGYLAARRWRQQHGHLRIPLDAIDYDAEAGTSFPVGAWISEQRRVYTGGTMSASRVALLERLGMVWHAGDAAFNDGLAMARAYHAVHGHLVPPKTAAINGYPVGQWLQNQRRANIGERHPERWDALAAIDPDWHPQGRPDPAQRWSLDWQRNLSLVTQHLADGGHPDDLAPGISVDGEEVGGWLHRQRQPTTWAALSEAQRQALTELGVTPEELPEAGAPPAARPSRTDKWAINLAAAQAYREREGHLQVPRKHIETLHIDGFTHDVKLGVWIMNQRGRRATLTTERAAALTALGMRWA